MKRAQLSLSRVAAGEAGVTGQEEDERQQGHGQQGDEQREPRMLVVDQRGPECETGEHEERQPDEAREPFQHHRAE